MKALNKCEHGILIDPVTLQLLVFAGRTLIRNIEEENLSVDQQMMMGMVAAGLEDIEEAINEA